MLGHPLAVAKSAGSREVRRRSSFFALGDTKRQPLTRSGFAMRLAGFWWQDTRTAMPPGRQPGELAGWTPLAGDVSHQAAQNQKDALDMKEHFVQG